jgi:hypothetical protein
MLKAATNNHNQNQYAMTMMNHQGRGGTHQANSSASEGNGLAGRGRMLTNQSPVKSGGSRGQNGQSQFSMNAKGEETKQA